MSRKSNPFEKSPTSLFVIDNSEGAQASYSDFYDLSPVGFVTLNEQSLILEANLTTAALLGVERRALIGRPFVQFVSSDGIETYACHHKELWETGTLQSCELQMNREDQTCFWAELLATTSQDAHGAPICRIVLSDITERKQVGEMLRESEERFRRLFQSIPAVAVQGYGPDGTTQYWNHASERIYGYSEQEAIGQNLLDLIIPPEMREEVTAAIEQMAQTGEPIPASELSLMRKDGSRVSVFSSHAIVKVPGRHSELFCVDVDISERKQAEEALKQAHNELEQRVADRTEALRQVNEDLRTYIAERKRAEAALRASEEKLARLKKMESLGLLAGGVAHDLNNVLSGIVSYPELLLLNLSEDSGLRKPIETIHACGKKAAAIVQDLLTIARGVAIEKKPLNLNDLIDKYLTSSEHLRISNNHPTVRVTVTLDSQLLNIMGSALHIEKAVMNLVVNACEAIDGIGNVELSTQNHYIDRSLKGYGDVKVGEYAVLSIRNDGPPIPGHDLDRIFEPFYSKKVMGRSGTGLGLAVVWNVMQDHNGYIDVISDERGTTFRLYFPITRETPWEEDPSFPIDAYKGNGEMVLVVDDVESQRDISCRMLKVLGYETKAISSGEGAVEYFKENSADLILLDMIMEPGINGRETYERIAALRPKQKALIVSGFAQTDEIKAAQRLGAGKYLKKPLTLQALGMAVKEELEK